MSSGNISLASANPCATVSSARFGLAHFGHLSRSPRCGKPLDAGGPATAPGTHLPQPLPARPQAPANFSLNSLQTSGWGNAAHKKACSPGRQYTTSHFFRLGSAIEWPSSALEAGRARQRIKALLAPYNKQRLRACMN